MNRQQRRAAKRAQKGTPKYTRMTQEQRIDALVKNGITVDDLEENYKKGFKAGFKAASEPVVKTCYAAMCLAANELHGFGTKRCKDLLNLVDSKIMYSLTSMEIVDEVWQKLGLHLDFAEVVGERVEEGEKDAGK